MAEDIATQAQFATQIQHLSHLSKTLADEKYFLRAVLDSTEDAIVAFNRHGAFVLCNRKFETLFKIKAAELAGHDESWLRTRLRQKLEAPESFWSTFGDEQAVRQDVVRLLRKNRTKPLVLNWYSGPVLDSKGALAGRIAVQRDITRETEVDQMKTDFISIVSHELRTPMTSIRGYVDLILDGDTGEVNDLQRQFLKTVQRNTLRLTAMVNDMLDISRIEGGGIEFELNPIPLQGIIDQVVTEAQPQIAARNLALSVVCEGSSGKMAPLPSVLGDHDRLMQIFTNLLSNAIKYTPAPPESAGEISIVIGVSGSMADIAIRDTGIGIAAEDMEMLFQKFFRADNPQTRDVDGSGLGLSITRALVEKMGGELNVQSAPGIGSEFSFSLPLAAPAQPAAAPCNDTDILIVTSNGDTAQAAQERLRSHNTVNDEPPAIDVAYSGAEAMRQLAVENVRAIILDLLMPHGDAFRVLRFLNSKKADILIAPLQNPLREAHAPTTLALPPRDDAALQQALRATLRRDGIALKVQRQTLPVDGDSQAALDAALDSLGIGVVPVETTVQALAATLEDAEVVSAIWLDMTQQDGRHDEQALQLVEALTLQMEGGAASVASVIFACGKHLFLCGWPSEGRGIENELEKLVQEGWEQILTLVNEGRAPAS